MRRDQVEIGSSNTSGDEGAMWDVNTTTVLPHVANFGAGASAVVSTIHELPPSPIPSGGHSRCVNHQAFAASETGARTAMDTVVELPPSPIINQLIDLQRQRLFSIKSQSRCDRSCESFITQAIGYSSPKEKDTERSGEKERKALFARAAIVRTAVEKSMKPKKSEGQLLIDNQCRNALEACGGDQHILSACTQIIILSAKSREAWDGLRATAEKKMADLAKSFPAYGWVTTVPGFKELGLAVIIGETGDLSGYATKERVWKRLGLAPYKGRSCSSWAANELTKKEWIEAGYSKRRRGTIAGDIGIPLFFNKCKNAYGSVYTARRAYTAVTHPDWTKGHSDNDARRIMTKALIEDLWRVWNEMEPLNG